MKTLSQCLTLLACLALGPPRPCLADPPAPPSGGGTNTFLDSWSFEDTTNWTSDGGYYPSGFTNLAVATGGDGTALGVDSASPAYLAVNLVETDGTVELQVDQGGILLWLRPHWDSGTGPGWPARLVEVGAYTTNASYGWFALYTDSAGANLYFSSQNDSGSGATWLSAPVSFASNTWTFIALSYCSTNTALYVNGELLTNGPGVTLWPGAAALASPWHIGSDSSGLNQIRGDIDDLETYGGPLDPGLVQSTYEVLDLAYYGSATLDRFQSSSNSYWTNSPTFRAVVGSGNLTFVGAATNCQTSTNVWIASPAASVVGSGTNATVTFQFTIAGGAAGVPYDVFANAALSTNSPAYGWAWMGQGQSCCTYSLTNLPVGAAYLVLGTTNDSDGDGLTDAYERLVTHTSTNNACTSGDGIPDGWKVIWGLNPLLNTPAQTGQRANYTYYLEGWLSTVTGKRTEAIGIDFEGNVTGDANQ